MLAAAVATFLLAYAHTYPQMLLASLSVGISGGSLAVGVAYVSRWYPTEKQGTALGIFGAGNVGDFQALRPLDRHGNASDDMQRQANVVTCALT